MKSRTPPLLIVGAVALAGIAGAAWHAARTPADTPPQAPAVPDDAAQPAPSGAGVAANMYFVDKNGNPRTPTPAEMRALSDALKKDLARITGPHHGKHYVRTEPSGAIAATVATTDLAFLVATENPDGTITITHSGNAGDVLQTPATAGAAPEM